ncbi:MAG: hypothetical protein V4633_13550 [Pseudomonadota bacterium]
MALETPVTHIGTLVATNPGATDGKNQGDDHIRNIKAAILYTFPNVAGVMLRTHTELNTVTDRGLIAGQTWTGTHVFGADTSGVTASFGASGTKYATLDFVNAVATSAVLPGLTGNEYKFLTTTNGTSASFSNLLKSTVIRMADGTDLTKLVAFDLSGLTTATTRTVTIPNKSGTMAMTSDTALVLIATLTPTVAANLDFLTTFSSSYDNYLIVCSGITVGTTDSIALRLAVAGVADAGANYYRNAGSIGTDITARTEIIVSPSILAGGKGGSAEITIKNVNDAVGLKATHSDSMSQSVATPGYANHFGDGVYVPASVASGFRLFLLGGASFAATGKVRVYGYTNS